MFDTICWKIEKAYVLPYQEVIYDELMEKYEATNETISSARVYFICKLKRKGFIIKFFSEPEVLYIGATFHKKKRFGNHKKLLQATTMLNNNDEQLVVYFLHMRFSYFGISYFENNPMDVFNEIKDLNNRSSVELLERVFIKLFNPPLNERYNDSDIKNDNLIQKKLIENNVNYICIDIGMEDTMFNFKGGKREKNKDWYFFDIANNIIIDNHPLLIL